MDHTVTYSMASRLGKVRFGGGHGSAGDRQGIVKREQGTSDLSIGSRVDLATLDIAKEVVYHFMSMSALAVIACSVANVLRAGCRVDMLLVEVEAIVCRWLRSIIAASMWLREAGDGASHLSVVVIIAGGFGSLWSVVHAGLVILARSGENRVIGMGLDVLLQVLRSLERLATELALVRLERDVNTDVRSDVITLYSGGATRVPLAGEAQVVCALATNMTLTNMFIERLGVGKLQAALVPAADELPGRIHGVTKRRRHLRVGRGTAGIVAGAGAAIGARGGRGISW